MSTIIKQLKQQLKQQEYPFLDVFISKYNKQLILIDFPETYSEDKIKQLNKELEQPLKKVGYICEARAIFQF